MFDSSLFNQYHLFQKFGGLYKKLSPLGPEIDDFLYCANSAILRILAVKKYNYDCIREFREREQHLTITNTPVINFFSSTLIHLLNEIPIFFSDMKKLQDRFLNIISIELGLKLKPPSSLHRAINRTLEKFNIPEEICELIYKYWDEIGKKVKDYRDIDQHWHRIGTKSWLQLKPERKIVVLLPDSKHQFTYNKKINAIEFMETSFKSFHEMIENVSKLLGYKENKPFPYGIKMDLPTYIIPGQEDRLVCLMVFDKGPYSGTEFYTLKKQNSLSVRLLPKTL